MPYELKCWVKDFPLDVGEEPTNDIYTLDALYRVGDLECVFHDLVESNQGFQDVKPLLLPLSKLAEHLITIRSISEDWEQEWIDHVIDFSEKIHEANISACPYDLMQHLLENHFDVFNLIGRGLAINKKTITDK